MELIKEKKRGRPPKAPRVGGFETRSMLIRSGTEMLTERGYVNSDIDTILKRVGVPKGSFYYYFDSKESFILEVINNYAQYFAYKLDKHLLNESLLPLERLFAFYEDVKKGMRKYKFNRGCLVGNLGQEVNALPDSYRELLNATIEEWQDKIMYCLEKAQQSGALSLSANCKTLATFFWIGWEGAVMHAKLLKNDEPLTIFINFFIDGLPQ